MHQTLDENKCVCSHSRDAHLINGKASTCSLNQQQCDCWAYTPRQVERHEIFDLKIAKSWEGF
jgi:hypothetical protein